MYPAYVIGRVAFVLIFLFSGVRKLLDLNYWSGIIGTKVTIPSFATGVTSQLEASTGMTTPQLLTIAAAATEILGAILIIVNVGSRFGAILLLLFTVVATFYFHDFWNMTGAEQNANLIQALKNLSIVGGLLVLFVLGPWRPFTAPRVARIERLD